MGTLANSEDPDEMQHNAAFHQGLHCLLISKQSSRTEIYHNLEKFYVGENPSEYKWLNNYLYHDQPCTDGLSIFLFACSLMFLCCYLQTFNKRNYGYLLLMRC